MTEIERSPPSFWQGLVHGRRRMDTQPFSVRFTVACLGAASWEEVAAALAISVEEAKAHAARIGLRFQPVPEDPAREPLPEGHPRTWGAITSGTCLAGSRYEVPKS